MKRPPVSPESRRKPRSKSRPEPAVARQAQDARPSSLMLMLMLMLYLMFPVCPSENLPGSGQTQMPCGSRPAGMRRSSRPVPVSTW